MRKIILFVFLFVLTTGFVSGGKQPRMLAICRIELSNNTSFEAIYSVYELGISSCFANAIQISEGYVFTIDINFKIMRFSFDSIKEEFTNFEYFDQESMEGYKFGQVRQIRYLKNCKNEMGLSYPAGYTDTVSLLSTEYILYSSYVHLFIPQDFITLYRSLGEKLMPSDEVNVNLKDIRSFEFLTKPSSLWTDLISLRRGELSNLDYYPSFYHEICSDSVSFVKWRDYFKNDCQN